MGSLVLGKRKRRDQVINHDNGADPGRNKDCLLGSLSLFRQRFEASFEPLEELKLVQASAHDTDIISEDDTVRSDWDGLSDSDDKDQAEIVYQAAPRSSAVESAKEEFKTFMTARPPSSDQFGKSSKKDKSAIPVSEHDGETEAANLKKDLALQRLLKESHLLESSQSLSHTGRNRHKALDLRLQDMGSKTSVFAQQNMPIAQRKGIAKKSTEREDLRRKHALENGIIIEKAVKGGGKAGIKRQRGIGAPSVGKFQGGMLKLSKKDLATIQGPKKSSKGRR